jgi:Fe-S cluster assembly ATP-binding protein
MSQTPVLKITDVRVSVENKEVVKGVSLTINKGEVHALMGKNGSGKSSLSNALMGHPYYSITSGTAELNGESILEMEADERSKAGMFLAFQYPQAVPGVTVANFLRSALIAHRGADADMRGFRKELFAAMDNLEIDHGFAGRYVNDGFSGGEKKRLEILQLRLLAPTLALLDETDSGLDIDALKIVSKGINEFHSSETGILLVTHYQRMLNYVKPDFVHVMIDGEIVKTGGPEIALELEDQGYETFQKPEATVGA